MGNPKTLSLKVLLHDGTPNGIVTIRNEAWADGELTIGSRDNAMEIANGIYKGGVYILFSQLMCAVLPLEEIKQKIQMHTSQEKWWYKIAVISSRSKTISAEESYYLASLLREKASKNGCLLYNDEVEPNTMDAFQKATLDEFAVAAINLFALSGAKMLLDDFLRDPKAEIEIIEGREGTRFAKTGRKEAKDYLAEQGIIVNNYFNYTAKRDSNGEYWINARIETLTKDWTIIFNDPDISELIIAEIPAYTLMIGDKNKPGLMIRPDKNCIDIGIDSASFIDRKSGVDFSTFLSKRIKYRK